MKTYSFFPVADFGSVTFTDASATSDGDEVDVTGASIIDLETSAGKALTSCSASGSTV
ncbi:hypothetical protein LSUE1_G009510, partial [Lachnellula suecica]